MHTDHYQLALQVGQALNNQGLKLVVAESCTGGWISKLITDVPGSSDWFEGGFITYSNQMKQSLLGVQESLLINCGAVSREVAEAMACGALTRTNAHVSVAVSGIAGPDGGEPNKPVGTVWIAWSRVIPGYMESSCEVFSGDRTQVRLAAATAALEGVKRCLGGTI